MMRGNNDASWGGCVTCIIAAVVLGIFHYSDCRDDDADSFESSPPLRPITSNASSPSSSSTRQVSPQTTYTAPSTSWQSTRACWYCGGRGYEECIHCIGGWQECPSFLCVNGYEQDYQGRWVPCSTCGGANRIVCAVCDGRGYTVCTVCNGTGRVPE